MAVLRSMCELPCLVHYLNLNKEKFDLTDIDTEILEKSLLATEDVFVSDLFARILRHILQSPAVRIATFESHLTELLTSRGATWNPLTNTEYKDLSPPDKLKLLKWLADQTKEKSEISELLLEDLGSDPDSQESRIINIGQDSDNRTYWYLDDLRLYRSKTANPTKDSGDWKCVAITIDEWQSLIQDLEKSTNAQEKDLYTYLNEQLFKPTIKPVLENKASGSVALTKKPTDDEIQAKEEADINKMQAANTTDPKANPELAKVLNEEPKSTGISKEHNDKCKDDHPRKSVDERKGEFTKTAGSHGGGTKGNQENVNSQSSQHHGLKVSQPMPPHSIAVPSHYPTMNGSNGSYPPPSSIPNHPGWNGPRPPMTSYNNVRPESPGVWGPGGLANPGRFDISHNIVPDEKLTPEQLQNRQAGMESLKKLHEMLSASEQDRQMQQMTDFSHISMAQDAQGPPGSMPGPHMHPPNDEFGMYGPCPPHLGPGGAPMPPNGPPMGPGAPPMGPGQQMVPASHQMGGPPMGPGGPPGAPPAGHMMGAGGQPMGPGMMAPPGHPHHHPMGSPMAPGPGPMPPGPHMAPGGPMPPQMPGGQHMEMGMYPGPHNKPPPPYQAPMPPVQDAPPPRTSKAKKRKGSTQSPAPQSPMGQSLKSPKYPIPPSPLAGPPGSMTAMPAGFPMPEQGGPPGSHPQMFKGPHGPLPPHSTQQGNLMQAGPPEPFQGHPSSGTNTSHKPPPSYSQSTNKRTPLESITAPSPQKQYYSQFENQELTIIKQPNTAYQSTDPSDPNQFPSQPSRPQATPGSPMNSRSVTNITSAPLANLAKGVEQIQQTMVEGGPFRDLQQIGQQAGQAAVGGGAPNPMSVASGQPAANSIPSSSGGPQSSQPSVNNTFVNAHMSIGQVNIQNVNASQQHNSFDGAGRPAQMQQNVDVTMNTGSMTPGTPRFEEPTFSAPNPATSSASVKVQAKGASTLQYLPVSQKAAIPPAEPALPSKQHAFDFPRNEPFPHPGMDAKTAASKMNYYPDNSRLPPPPPQRLPHTVNSSIPLTSQAGNPAPGMPQYSAAQGSHPAMTMHPSPAPHMSPGVPPSHPHHPQFTNGHPSMMPPASSMYSPPSAPYAPIAVPAGHEGPPANMGMMEGMPAPGPQMMGHAHQPSMHPQMMQPQSPFAPQGPMDFGPAPHGVHPGFPQEIPPGGPGFPSSLPRQMSHPGHPGMPPQHMMSPQGGPYMGGPNGPGPYMMGGL